MVVSTLPRPLPSTRQLLHSNPAVRPASRASAPGFTDRSSDSLLGLVQSCRLRSGQLPGARLSFLHSFILRFRGAVHGPHSDPAHSFIPGTGMHPDRPNVRRFSRHLKDSPQLPSFSTTIHPSFTCDIGDILPVLSIRFPIRYFSPSQDLILRGSSIRSGRYIQ